MLIPKGQGPTPARRSSQPAESRLFAEPRSFAPRARALGGKIEVRRPEAWEALARESLAPPPTRAVAAEATEATPDPRRRALIVIPALNEAELIASVIARVLDDDGLVDPLVVVADGGSSDATRDIVREIAAGDPRVWLIDNPGRLQSAALNLAASAVAGDRPWLVRVDAHADYPRNYASSLIAEALRTGATSVVVSMDTVGEHAFQRAAAAAQNS